MELRVADVQEIVRIFSESDMEELRLEIGSSRLHLSKVSSGAGEPRKSNETTIQEPKTVQHAEAPPPGTSAINQDPPAAAPAAAADIDADDGTYALRSPLLGVFYRRPSPDDAPFVEVGDDVSADDPVCVIEVMKMYTQVAAGVAGRIVEICVEDGDLVETGQVLLRIDPE